MVDFEAHIDLDGLIRLVGLARSNHVRGTETILFAYDNGWLQDPGRFSLEPAFALTRGSFASTAGLTIFGSIGDSAPDSWGRRLMQRAGRRRASGKIELNGDDDDPPAPTALHARNRRPKSPAGGECLEQPRSYRGFYGLYAR